MSFLTPKLIWVIQPFIWGVKIQWPQLECFRKITTWKNKCGYWYWQILSKNLHSWQFLVNFVQMIKNKSILSLLDGTVAADRWPFFIAGWPVWRTDLELTHELMQQLKIGKYSTLCLCFEILANVQLNLNTCGGGRQNGQWLKKRCCTVLLNCKYICGKFVIVTLMINYYFTCPIISHSLHVFCPFFLCSL